MSEDKRAFSFSVWIKEYLLDAVCSVIPLTALRLLGRLSNIIPKHPRKVLINKSISVLRFETVLRKSGSAVLKQRIAVKNF